jgi:formylglycine-generating enzyme required for sulfatase activity
LLVIFCLSFAQENSGYVTKTVTVEEIEKAKKAAEMKIAAVEEAKKKIEAIEAEKKQRSCIGTCEAKWNDDHKKKKAAAEEELAKKAAEAEIATKLLAEMVPVQQTNAVTEAVAKKVTEEEAKKAAEEAAKKAAEQAKQDSIANAKKTAEEAAKKAAEEAAKKAAEQAKQDSIANAKKAVEEAAKKAAEEAAKITIEMVKVEGSLFSMGCTSEQGFDCNDDERPTHNVQLNDFLISKYLITQEVWKKVMGTNPSHFSGNELPVESVSWDEIQSFIKELNIKTGKKYRLLTESEWEYAARGGRKSNRQKYSGNNNVDKVAWCDGNSQSTQPIGKKQPNELGIFDMSGNVWEWVQDWKDSYSEKTQFNPKGPVSGSKRAFRGGSWQDPAAFCRIARRGNAELNYRSSDLGFRLALDP